MDIAKENRDRAEFKQILISLSGSQDALKEPKNRAIMYQRLENLYYIPGSDTQFRHFYSDIFSVLTQIQENPQMGDINILGQNISVIRNGYTSKQLDKNGKPIDISDSLRKLYDHVSLDIARISFSQASNRSPDEKMIAAMQSQVNSARYDIAKTKEEQRIIAKKLKNAQKDYITILGIFAAIVLTFTGGIAFSTSVLQNMHTVSAYRIVLVASLIGIVLLNALCCLFYYVNRIVSDNENQKIRPFAIGNIILAAIMIITLLLWGFGVVEKRDAEIGDTCSLQIEQQIDYQNQGQ